MAWHSLTQRLIGVLEGWYTPRNTIEIRRLAEIAKLNKLYLAYLRRVRDTLHSEWLSEENKFRRYIESCTEIANTLRDLNYAFYKFRKPLEHVSVDLDILIDSRHILIAVSRLRERGFRVIIREPYTITLEKNGFIVDLYTHPAFAWIVYIDGEKLLRDYSEEFELGGVYVRGLTRGAEATVSAAHAVYKEHMVLLIDCYTLWKWMSREVLGAAEELSVRSSVNVLGSICKEILRGVEAPVKTDIGYLTRLYTEKLLEDPAFRSTIPNLARYVLRRRDIGRIIASRTTRKSY